MVGVAVIGAGAFGQAHLRSLEGIAGADVKWICDSDLVRARDTAARYGVPCSTDDFENVLSDSDVQLVDLVTPVFFHATQALAALGENKSVLCEKPMAMNPAEAESMAIAAEASNGSLYVKYHQRFDPVHQRVRELMATGEYGHPLVAHFSLLGDHLAALRSKTHWRGNPQFTGGGCLFESGAHLIDLAHFFFGPARRVTATTSQRAAENPFKAEDTATVIIEFAAGIELTFTGYWASGSWAWRKDIFTDEQFTIRVETASNDNALILGSKGHDRLLLQQPGWFQTSVDTCIRHYVECCHSGTEPLFGVADFIEPLVTLDAAYRSAAEGRTIALD